MAAPRDAEQETGDAENDANASGSDASDASGNTHDGSSDGSSDAGNAAPDASSDAGDAGNDAWDASSETKDAGSDAPDASSDAGNDACVPYNETLAVVPSDAEFLFVIDRSGSMDWPATGTSNGRWTELKSALNSVLPTLSGSLMGLLTFPEMDGTSELFNCKVASSPDIGLALGTSSGILTRLVAADPRAGETPTPDALATAATYLGSISTSRDRFVVLVTDGLPEPNCGATVAATVAAISSLRSGGTDTFVIGIVGPDSSGNTSGIPALQDALNKMADAGGRARSGAVRYYDGPNAAGLTGSLAAVAASATDCQFILPSAPAQPLQVQARLDGVPVASTDFTVTAGVLTFSGNACAQIQAGTVSSITVADDCA